MIKSTKTLLIFPPFTVSSSDYPTPDPPLGLGYLAAVLEKHRYPVKVLDALALGIDHAVRKEGGLLKVGLSKGEVKKFVRDFRPDIVGVSCSYTAHARDAHEVAGWVKEVNPKILIVFGGAHATACAPLVLKDKNVDVVVMGEGELTLLELVDKLEKGKGIKRIKGTCQRQGKRIIKNAKRDYVVNLDDLPDLAWHLLPMDIYLKNQEKTREFSKKRPRTNMITSRGCPGNCVFCSIHATWGHRWRPRSPKRVVDEMEYLVKTYGVREFYILDDNLTLQKDRLVKICDLILKKRLNVSWACPNGVALWTLDRQVLQKMKKSGFYRVTFGIESGCQKTLEFIRKPMVLEKAKEMINISNDIGLWTHSTFIFGFPRETKEEIEETINWAVNSELDFASFYIATPYAGTDLYAEFVKNGLLEEGDEEKMDYSSLSVAGNDTCFLKRDELDALREKAYADFFADRTKRYLNPFYSLPHIRKKIKNFDELNYFLRLLNNVFGMKLKSITTGKFQSHFK